MRIGFDAKRAFSNHTGLGHYARNMLWGLQKYQPDHHYILYTPGLLARHDLSFLEERSNVQIATPVAWYERAAPALWRSWGVKRNLRDDRLELYHGLSHELPAGLRSTPVKKVVTIHDLIFLRYPSHYSLIDRSRYHWKVKHACASADAGIAVSRQTKSDLMEFYEVDPEKIRVVYQGVNPLYTRMVAPEVKEAVRLKYGLPGAFILSVGSIIERKNLLRVVEALGILEPSLDPVLVVVGKGGDYETEVRKRVEEIGLSSRVFFLGSVPQADLVALYQMAAVFVYPSLFEGFGIPIIDALVSGVPVITSRGSCFAESAGPGSVFVDPLQTAELASALGTVLGDGSLRERMILAGREHAALFDGRRLSAQLMQIYQGLGSSREW